MLLQVARMAETFLTQQTLERLVSGVDSHVNFQISRLTKGLVTHVTFVRLLSTVNITVLVKMTRSGKLFATNGASDRLLCGMILSMSCEVGTTLKTLATFCTLVCTCVNVRVPIEGAL